MATMNESIARHSVVRALENVRYGAAFWLVFGVIALYLRGIRWDEDYEWAQVIVGAVEYPEGHPLLGWIGGAFSLQVYGAALLLKLTSSEAIVCGVRNLLFIWATVFPPFLLGAALSRKAIVGHITVVFILLGVHLAFDGAYPQFLWPGMFSNGHVGTGYALVFLSAVLFARGRVAAFLLGLMPAVHMGQVLPCFALGGLCALYLWRVDRGALWKIVPFFLIGTSISAAFYFYQRGYAVPAPVSGTYFSALDARAVWEGTIANHDMHRSIPRGNSHLLAAGFLLLGWMLLRNGRFTADERGPVYRIAVVFGLIVMGIVYGVMAVQFTMGERIPYMLLGWLPYRLANLLPPIFVAMLVSYLFEARGKRFVWQQAFIGGVLGVVLLQPYAGAIMDDAIAARYFGGFEWITFGLFGVVCSELAIARWTRSDLLPVFVGICAVGVLAAFHQFGAACVLAGAAMPCLVYLMRREKKAAAKVWEKSVVRKPLSEVSAWGYVSRAAAMSATALIVLSILRTEFENRAYLPRGELERSLAEYLEGQPDETDAAGGSGEQAGSLHQNNDAFLVAPPYQLLTQAQTGHAVMTDLALPFFVGYAPSLGPSIQKIYNDIYGIDLLGPQAAPGSDAHWTRVWEQRSKAEWRALGATYGFDVVIAPAELKLALRPILVSETNVCYSVGAAEEALAAKGIGRMGIMGGMGGRMD